MSKTPKSISPRIHEVHTHKNQQFQFNIRTDYDQRLWPVPGKPKPKDKKLCPLSQEPTI